MKNVEHALCEYDKYFRSALGVQIKEREYSDAKSGISLDDKNRCGKCSKVAESKTRIRCCCLCSRSYHTSCRVNWRSNYHKDGSWLCDECHLCEKVWEQEDFDYEETDKNDLIERAFFGGAAKKAARLNLKKKEKKQIECIDLSWDEEEEKEETEEADDEIEYLQEIKGHFFGLETIVN